MWIKVADEGAARVARALRSKNDPAIQDVREQIRKKLETPKNSEALDLQETQAVLVGLEHLIALDHMRDARATALIKTAIPKIRTRYHRLVEKAADAAAKK